jgi:hypothetical protein
MPVVDQTLMDMFEPEPGKDDKYDAVATPPTISRTQATTSSNPSRPRTLSAGYDPESEVLTVLFRDGKWWEYRGVPENMWQDFKAASSKGTYLRESGLDSWDDMGPADISGMPRHRRTQLNQLTAWANNMYPGERPYER